MLEIFEPKGDKAQWEYLFDAVKDFPYGEQFSFGRLQSLSGFDVRKSTSLIPKTNRELLKQGFKKELINVRNYGYKIGEPREQLAHGAKRKTRAGRQLKKGLLELNGLDHQQLSPEERTRAIHLVNHMATSLGTVQSKQKTVLKKVKETVKVQEDTIQQVNNMLSELSSLKAQLTGGKSV